MLLDKIKDTKEVLNLMIRMLLDRKKPLFFISHEIRGLPEFYSVEPRVTE